MVAFKGRSSMKQYVANKPIKRGFKLWSLCSFDGYVLVVDVYTGADSQPSEDSLGSRAVLSVTEGYHHRGHIVYADRFFSSPTLAEELLGMGTFLTGTVKKNRRDFPRDLELVASRGDYAWRMKPNGLLAGVWKDSKEVPFVSTAAPPALTQMPRCQRRINNQICSIQIPPALDAYNKAKSGVDLADQRRSYCGIRVKQLRRWWLPLFFALFDIAIENGRYIYNYERGDSISSKAYRLSLVERLSTPSQPLEPVKDAKLGHFPIHTTAKKNRRCIRCSELQIRTMTVHECRICQVPLCLQCFGPYHIQD